MEVRLSKINLVEMIANRKSFTILWEKSFKGQLATDCDCSCTKAALNFAWQSDSLLGTAGTE